MAGEAIKAGLIDELRQAVPTLYSFASRGARLQGLEEVIRPWFATYPQPERSAQEWAAWWAAYDAVCGHQPKEALAGALLAWSKSGEAEFLPKPGRLSELARSTPTAAFRFAGRAHQILQRVATNMDRDQVKTPEQREAVASMLADFQQTLKPVREHQRRVLERGYRNAEKTDAQLPYSGGRPAPGSALTAEMLASLGRPVPGPAFDAPREFD